MKVSVQHWRYEDGKTCPNPGNPFPIDPPPQGWYCWAYTNNDSEFETWMEQNCPTADYTHRFNSGNPMYTVHITNEKEANIFALRWING